MKNSLCPVVVIAALLGQAAARAQGPSDARPGAFAGAPTLPGPAEVGPRSATSPPGGGYSDQTAAPPGMTDYLTYLRPGACCGPVGGSGPITAEVFLRPGISFPIGGSIPGIIMAPGFMLQGGTRALFFNPRQDLAWTFELGITSVWYDAQIDRVYNLTNLSRVRRNGNGGVVTDQDGVPQVDTIPNLPVIPSSLNETYVHASLGHEIYVLGSADCGDDAPKARVGYDLGGRWGSAKMILVKQRFPNDGGNPNRDLFRHRTDVVGGIFAALHTDYEVPFKCAMFFAGVRTEFSYIFADLLQPQNNTDLMSINVLANFGVRF